MKTLKRKIRKEDLESKGLPFECENCGNKPTAEQVVEFNGACELCNDSIIAYTVDTAELIVKLKMKQLEHELDKFKAPIEIVKHHTSGT